MKKRCIAVVLCWVLLVSLLLPFRKKAYADPLTLTWSQLAGAAYAMGSSMGINWGFVGSAAGAESLMVEQLQHYSGSSLEFWGSGEIKALAGKLAIAQTGYEAAKGIYENLKDFIQNLVDNEVEMVDVAGAESGQSVPSQRPASGGFWISGSSPATLFYSNPISGQNYSVMKFWPSYDPVYSISFSGLTGTVSWYRRTNPSTTGSADFQLQPYMIDSSSVPNYNTYDKSLYPKALPLNASWQGDWGEAPDTNLDQLIGSVFDGLADLGDIDVTGDIVEPAPVPTPAPTWTPVDDIIDGINQTGEIIDGIGNDIGNISGHLDDIGDQMDDVTGALEGVQEGIQTQTGVISGALDQAAQDVVDAIGEQTATLDQTLTETAEGVQDIAQALQPGEIEPKKFDLRGLFPFCIPFDIHNLLQKFQAAPVAPHVQLPFVIQSIGFSYTLDLDFSVFDPVAQALRTVEFIVFAIGLAWATSKVIKW